MIPPEAVQEIPLEASDSTTTVILPRPPSVTADSDDDSDGTEDDTSDDSSSDDDSDDDSSTDDSDESDAEDPVNTLQTPEDPGTMEATEPQATPCVVASNGTDEESDDDSDDSSSDDDDDSSDDDSDDDDDSHDSDDLEQRTAMGSAENSGQQSTVCMDTEHAAPLQAAPSQEASIGMVPELKQDQGHYEPNLCLNEQKQNQPELSQSLPEIPESSQLDYHGQPTQEGPPHDLPPPPSEQHLNVPVMPEDSVEPMICESTPIPQEEPKIIESVQDYDSAMEDIIVPIIDKSGAERGADCGPEIGGECGAGEMTCDSVMSNDSLGNQQNSCDNQNNVLSKDNSFESDEHNSSFNSSTSTDLGLVNGKSASDSGSSALDTVQMTPPPSVPGLPNTPKVSPTKLSQSELAMRNVGHATKTHKIHTSPPQGVTALAPPPPTMSTLPIISAAVPGPPVNPVQKCAMVPFTPETIDVRQLGLESPAPQNGTGQVGGYADCAQQGYTDSHQSPGMMTSPASNTNFSLPNPSPSNNSGYMSNSPSNSTGTYNIRQASPSNASFPMANPSPGANVNANFTMPNPSPSNNYTSMPTPSPTNSHNSYNTGMATPSPTGRNQCAPHIVDNNQQSYNMQQSHNIVVQQQQQMPPQSVTPHPGPPPLTPVPTEYNIHPMCASAPPPSTHRLVHNRFDNPCAMPVESRPPACPGTPMPVDIRPPGCPGTPMQSGYHQHSNSSCSLAKLQQLTNVVGGPGSATHPSVMELAHENAVNTMTPPPQHMSPPPLNALTNEHNLQAAQQRSNMTSPAVAQAAAYKSYNRRAQHKNSLTFTPNVTIQPGTNMLASYEMYRMQQPVMAQPGAAGYMPPGFVNQAQLPVQMGMMQTQQHLQQQMSQQRPQNAMYTYGYMPGQHFNMRR